jgi:hypothetical protein
MDEKLQLIVLAERVWVLCGLVIVHVLVTSWLVWRIWRQGKRLRRIEHIADLEGEIL